MLMTTHNYHKLGYAWSTWDTLSLPTTLEGGTSIWDVTRKRLWHNVAMENPPCRSFPTEATDWISAGFEPMVLMRSTGGYQGTSSIYRSAEVLISTPAFVAALAPSPSLGLLSLMSGIQSDGTLSQARWTPEALIGMTKGSAEEQKQNTWSLG